MSTWQPMMPPRCGRPTPCAEVEGAPGSTLQCDASHRAHCPPHLQSRAGALTISWCHRNGRKAGGQRADSTAAQGAEAKRSARLLDTVLFHWHPLRKCQSSGHTGPSPRCCPRPLAGLPLYLRFQQQVLLGHLAYGVEVRAGSLGVPHSDLDSPRRRQGKVTHGPDWQEQGRCGRGHVCNCKLSPDSAETHGEGAAWRGLWQKLTWGSLEPSATPLPDPRKHLTSRVGRVGSLCRVSPGGRDPAGEGSSGVCVKAPCPLASENSDDTASGKRNGKFCCGSCRLHL